MAINALDQETRRFGRVLHYCGILAVVVCGTTGYGLLYASTSRKILDTAVRIDELKQYTQNAPIARREHARLTKRIEHVTRGLEELQTRVPSNADAGPFLKHVSRIAREEELAISNFQPSKPVDRNGYAEMEVTVLGQGSFTSICSFFNRLAKLQRLSKVKNLEITAGEYGSEYPIKATLVIFFGMQGNKVALNKEVHRG